MKRTLLIVAAAVAFAGCKNKEGVFFASGTFDATEVILSGEVPGKLVEFGVSEGDALEAGQVVALIDTVQIHLQKLALLKNIDAIRTQQPDIGRQLAPYREKLDNAKRELERLRNLVASGAATQKQLDDAASEVAVAEKQLAAQENSLGKSLSGLNAQIAAAEIQAAQLDDQLSRCRITSPIAGTVVAKYAERGELSAQGRPLLKVADTDNVFLKAYLTSTQLTDVKLGQEVKVTADFGGGNVRRYDGRVTWISDKSEFTPKNIVTSDDRANMVYAVKIAVPNDGYVKIGMYGEVRLK